MYGSQCAIFKSYNEDQADDGCPSFVKHQCDNALTQSSLCMICPCHPHAESQACNSFLYSSFDVQVYGYNAWRQGMEISVVHVKQKDLPSNVFPDGYRPIDLPANPPADQPPPAAMAAPASVAGAQQAAQEAAENLAEAMKEGGSGDSKRRRVERGGTDGSLQEAVPQQQHGETNGAGQSGGRHPSSGEKRKRVSLK